MIVCITKGFFHHWAGSQYCLWCKQSHFCFLFSHSVVSGFLQPMDCSMPAFPVLHHLSELAQIHVHWVSDAIQPCHPLLCPSPPALNLSQHQVDKVLEFSFSISPSNEYSGLIPFRMDCDSICFLLWGIFAPSREPFTSRWRISTFYHFLMSFSTALSLRRVRL